jgi:hypothetical protein
VVRPALVLVLTSVLIAGCTQTGEATSGDRTVVTTTTLTSSRPPNAPGGPLPARPTTAADGACPLLATPAAAADVGVRMGRVAVLSSAGKPVGCRFYADQDPQFKASEHLPGPNQPVLQIVSTRYTDPTAAHNGMVRLAEAGTNAHQDALNSSTEGISFQVRFDPADAGQDWAYAFRKNATVVVVTTAQRDTSFDARAVAAAIVTRF